MLEEAKKQLHDEADYRREAEYAARYRSHLENDRDFVVPQVITEATCDTVLTMEYLSGIEIETLASADQGTRDFVMTKLLGLLFREIFEFRVVQTDPNFANYLSYQKQIR
ncbi:ABC1 family protein [Vibrio astriarenae]|nr:ABC1 family protein [Vibrio sp. C7]